MFDMTLAPSFAYCAKGGFPTVSAASCPLLPKTQARGTHSFEIGKREQTLKGQATRPYVMKKIFVITCVFVLAACMVGQDRGGTPPGDGGTLIGGIFSRAHASDSLEYWGVCNYKLAFPDFPRVRAVSDREGSPVELLRKIFSVDPEMTVSQDADGKIRMIEEDVPSDLLDVRIQHLQFTGEFHGPHAAVVKILMSPEVIAFRREHKIGPEPDRGPGFGLSSEAFAPEEPVALGDLHDVTVRQALDYILQTVQGFWLYESCKNSEGDRMIFLGFLENLPPEAVPVQPQK
jgi:hypothetical protein